MSDRVVSYIETGVEGDGCISDATGTRMFEMACELNFSVLWIYS